MTLYQTALMFAACGLGGLLAGRILARAGLRPADDVACGILGGTILLHALDAAGRGGIAGLGRTDLAALLGQIGAGVVGGYLAALAMRALARRLGPRR